MQAAQFYAEQHEVDTNYSKSYKDSWNLINGLSNQQLSVANLNTDKKVRIDPRTTKYESSSSNDSLNRDAIKCFNCQGFNHFARDCKKPTKNPSSYRTQQRAQITNQQQTSQDVPWPYHPNHYPLKTGGQELQNQPPVSSSQKTNQARNNINNLAIDNTNISDEDSDENGDMQVHNNRIELKINATTITRA